LAINALKVKTTPIVAQKVRKERR